MGPRTWGRRLKFGLWPRYYSGLGQVAQLVEQRTENPRVGSSILPLATLWDNNLRRMGIFGPEGTRG